MAPTHGRGRIATDFVTRFVLVLVFAGTVPPGIAAARDSAASTPPRAERPGVADVRVARDPETGEWGLAPLGTDAAALDRAPSPEAQMALNQSHIGLVAEARPDGSWMLDLQGRFQNYSIVRKDVTGNVHFDCSQDPLSLFEWLATLPDPVDAWGRPVR